MKYNYLPHTTTGKPLISKASPPYRPPAKWPWLLTVGLALLLQCLTIPPVYAGLITNPNVEFTNKVKAGTVTDEEMSRVKYVRRLMIQILEKTSASANQKIQDVEWVNKTAKGLIDLYGTASHIFGELKYLNRAPPNMRELLNKHRQAAGNALGKLSRASLEELKKKFVSKEALDFYLGEIGFLLEWSARTGDFEQDPFFNAGNFGFMNFVKEEELVQSYLNLVNIDNGVTPTNFIGTVALKVLGDLAQSGGGLEPSYYITNALGFAIDLASAKVLAEIAGQTHTDLAATSFLEYYYVGYLGNKTAFYSDLGVSASTGTLEDAFSAFLQQNSLTSSFPQGLWSQFMGDAVSKKTAVRQIRQYILNSALALRFDFKLNPDDYFVTEKELLLGKELQFYSNLDPILYEMGYDTRLFVVRLTKPNGQPFNLAPARIVDRAVGPFKQFIYTVNLDVAGEYLYEISYGLDDAKGESPLQATVTMTQDVYATDPSTNTNPPAIESAELSYGNDGRYHLKVGLRLPDAVFYDPTTQYQFKPSSRNPLKLTVTNNVFFLQPEEKTAVVTEPGELVSFDLTFDEAANGSSVLSQSGELDNLSVSYELINSFILPDGLATASFSLPIEYANLNPNQLVPYVEIRTNNQSSSLTQGDTFLLCPKNVDIDFKQWAEIGLAYRIDWPTSSRGILAGTLDGECLKFVAKETGQYAFLNTFSMVNGQPDEKYGPWLNLSGLIKKEVTEGVSTTATTDTTPSVGGNVQTSSERFKQVSSGYGHTCALKEEGSIVCWGNNESGQAIPPAGTFTQVSSGYDHTCALKIDGSLACWGNNYYGQAVPPTGNFMQVSSSEDHTCALKIDGTLACWGGTYGTEASQSGSFTQVSGGRGYTCALKTDDSLACWGYNGDGQATPPAGSFTQISSSNYHACAVKTDGSLACWGENNHGEAMPYTAGSFTQVSVGVYHTCALKTDSSLICWGQAYGKITPPAGSFMQISSGGGHTCALKNDGTVVCWGENRLGQLMSPAGRFVQFSRGQDYTCALKTDNSLVCWGTYGNDPAASPSGSFTQVSSGGLHTCALKTDGNLACWGDSEDGKTTPPSGIFTKISSGYSHSCALKFDGSLACWGSNSDGQTVSPVGSFTQVSGGGSHTCALKVDGSAACWGWNSYGQATPPAGSFIQLSSGWNHTCALKIDGSPTCWGKNDQGQATAPAGNFTQISSSGGHTCALKTDGSLVCWGNNFYGQATSIEGNFTQISTDLGDTTCGLKTDGSIICWGRVNEIIPSSASISNNTTPQQPMTPPTILSVTPTTAMLDTPTTFTFTGNNLVTGMGFTVADCEQTITDGFTNELAGGTDTQRQFQCIPRGTAGLKTGLVKNKPGGTVLYTFTVEVDGTSATAPQITSVTPTHAVIGATVTFTVTGTHLYEGMGFTVGDCVHSNIEVAGGTDTQRQFVCTQQGMNGNQRGLVKDFPGSNILYHFNVEATGGADSSPVPEITPEPVAPPPAPPVIIYPPTCAADSAILDTTCHGSNQTLKGDHKVEKWANISNLVITGTVENEGWISNTTIQAGATIKGGVLTGYITNEGMLIDIEFVGAILKGGTLAGKIVNNSRVGGKIQNVKLAAGTKITGGVLAGPIEGDCQQPALLENVKVKTGSVLKCVALGKNVKMEKGVTVVEK